MFNFYKTIKAKIKNNSGVSLAETLIAILIILLVSGLMTSSIRLANNQFAKQRTLSEANVLASTINSILTDELGFASIVTLKDSSNAVESVLPKSIFLNNCDNILSSVDGKIVVMDKNDDGSYIEILSKSSYPNGLNAHINSFNFYPEGSYFTVGLEIDDKDDNILYQKNIDILLVNVFKYKDGDNSYVY